MSDIRHMLSPEEREEYDALISGNAWVSDSAGVSGDAEVYGNAEVSGNAWVFDSARVSGDAEVSGNARIFDSARVYGDARVHGNALISGNADLARSRHVLTLGPVGSGDRTVTIHRHYDGPSAAKWGHRINAGCWSGTLGELADRIAGDGHGWPAGLVDRCRADYRAVIVVARIRVAEWEAEPLTAADHERWAS